MVLLALLRIGSSPNVILQAQNPGKQHQNAASSVSTYVILVKSGFSVILEKSSV
jgi:hypothetical protein